MKKLEKWLIKPIIQRAVYLLLLIFCIAIFSSNGTLHRAGSFTSQGLRALVMVTASLTVLGAQLIWNRKWLWMILCAITICFTLWLATLRLSQIIAGAGSPAKTVVWGVGVIGFTILLVIALAFVNWVMLHMKPRR